DLRTRADAGPGLLALLGEADVGPLGLLLELGDGLAQLLAVQVLRQLGDPVLHALDGLGHGADRAVPGAEDREQRRAGGLGALGGGLGGVAARLAGVGGGRKEIGRASGRERVW